MNGIYTVVWLDGNRNRQMSLAVNKTGFKLSMFTTQFQTTWDEVVSIDVDGPAGLEKRITATRLLTLGVFALAARKKTGEAFAFISFRDGDQMVLKFPKMSEPKVKAIFVPYQGLYGSSPAPSPEPSTEIDAISQLNGLADLRDRGVLTEEEFQDAKKKILGLP
jgi:hypothetical protein